tara:strand:+ start:473 stop:601 length:129 start_codon:yes stop_codon:yes gene_type:complete
MTAWLSKIGSKGGIVFKNKHKNFICGKYNKKIGVSAQGHLKN